MPRDIIADLVGQAYRTPHNMLMNVTLVDRKTDQRYNFKYDQWGLDPHVAIAMATSDLARMWRHVNA